MSVADFFAAVAGRLPSERIPVYVRCPDGIERLIWGYEPTTGDVFVSGWQGDVWLDCSDPNEMRVEFDPV